MLLEEKFNAVLIGWGNTFIGNRRVEEAKKQVCEYLKPHAKKVYELVDTEGIYMELKTIHPLFAGQRFSGKWKFRNYSFPEEKDEEMIRGVSLSNAPICINLLEKILL